MLFCDLIHPGVNALNCMSGKAQIDANKSKLVPVINTEAAEVDQDDLKIYISHIDLYIFFSGHKDASVFFRVFPF